MKEQTKRNLKAGCILTILLILSLLVLGFIINLLSDDEEDCMKYNTEHSKSILKQALFPYCIIYDDEYGKLNSYDFRKLYGESS